MGLIGDLLNFIIEEMDLPVKWHDITFPSDRNYCPIFDFLHANNKKNKTGVFLHQNKNLDQSYWLITIFKIVLEENYSKACLKRPLKNRQNIGPTYKWQLNEGWKYCRMVFFWAFCNTLDLH